MTDLDQLDIMRRAITALGLGQCAPEDLVAEARASESRREQDRHALTEQRARVSELEKTLEAARSATQTYASAEKSATGRAAKAETRVKDLEAKIASNVAEAAAREMRIAELERDLVAKDDSLKTANAALKKICEVIGAPVPVCPEDAIDAVWSLIAECEIAKGEAAEVGQVTAALDDAGAPKAYHLKDDGEREIPTPERIRLLGERVRTLRAQLREVSDATNYLNALIEAHNALDARGAPRLADGCVLSLAARVRSLPR